MARSDAEIQKDVMAELRWEPSLHDDGVVAAVRDGVVTLAGHIDSYFEKWRAERVVERVAGVRAIANELEVKLPSGSERPDSEIARAAADALKWHVSVPHDRINAEVENGWVTLTGEVDWNYQREAATRAIHSLVGVRGVANVVTVRAQPTPSDVKQRIMNTLKRSAEFDAARIDVEVQENKAILKGKVRSYAEAKDAERAAHNAPGITEVENRLQIEPAVYANI